MLALWQVDWFSGVLFFPYLMWVTVAGALNAAVWKMNMEEEKI
jgi:tryptophan-rich sensory protein